MSELMKRGKKRLVTLIDPTFFDLMQTETKRQTGNLEGRKGSFEKSPYTALS